MTECVGLLGRFFGHKFTARDWYKDANPYCYRCGYEPAVEAKTVEPRKSYDYWDQPDWDDTGMAGY